MYLASIPLANVMTVRGSLGELMSPAAETDTTVSVYSVPGSNPVTFTSVLPPSTLTLTLPSPTPAALTM